MRKFLETNVMRNGIIIFLLCLIAHAFEVLVVRTDETFFAECFGNKIFGILLLFAILRILNWHWKE